MRSKKRQERTEEGQSSRTNKPSVTSRREKVSLKGLENVKPLATLDILNPRAQEGLNKIFSSKFKQPKVRRDPMSSSMGRSLKSFDPSMARVIGCYAFGSASRTFLFTSPLVYSFP
ncbi:hypothetical protein M9H77_35855 [Catharanthus roseus]|uniref:Uncharacterized protein n=1 Tax=Catharanthus roseus TaxID=4058 RepID=A0ACB9ZQG8_CATRO|nr:hypothetical protein M9H77_35855 [Catharanthus roseus]